MPKRNCLFCCSYDNEMSKEHVIAQWLLNEIGEYNNTLKMYHFSIHGKMKSERKQVFNKLVNGLVCKECNNGWMSKLEEENKEGIISLMGLNDIEQIHHVMEFINKNHISLAKWIFKNAILFNYSVNYRKIVPRKHFIDLYKGILPDDVFINIGFVKEYKNNFNWSMGQTIHSIIPQNIEDYNTNKNYKISFQFRHLLVKVLRYRSYHNLYYKDEGAISLYPYFGLNEDFENLKYFNSLSQFDLNGAIHVFY